MCNYVLLFEVGCEAGHDGVAVPAHAGLAPLLPLHLLLRRLLALPLDARLTFHRAADVVQLINFRSFIPLKIPFVFCTTYSYKIETDLLVRNIAPPQP